MRKRPILPALAAAALCAAAGPSRAGGPLLIQDGKPILWASRNVNGGKLNSQTVSMDANGVRTIYYHVDSGSLGPLSNADALKLVDRIFSEYSAITPGIRFVNAGPILDPDTGKPVDVTSTNIGKFTSSSSPTFQNPIIFDGDGKITGDPSVLGFFGYVTFEPDFSAVTEAYVVLNGASLSGASALSTPSFLGVFTHEFGHFTGPLDHAQANGVFAIADSTVPLPPGFSRGQAYDLFAPFIETMYPFLFSPRAGATQPLDTGYFIATIDMDTKNALSSLYPTDAYRGSTGSIEGRVTFLSGGEAVDVSGIDVVSRRITQAPYPPPVGTQAYPSPPALDADGIPSPPPPQAATDPLATFSSAVTGLDFGLGTYRIQGLPPGDYLVTLQQLDADAIGGSSIGPLSNQLVLPVPEGFFDGGATSTGARDFVQVSVQAGTVTTGVDLRINGLDRSFPRELPEPNSDETLATAMDLGSLPVLVDGEASTTDSFQLRISFGGGETARLHDLYKLTLTETTLVWISLEPRSESGDLDLYLFPPPATGVTLIPLSGVTSYSAGPTAHELIAISLDPGTWYVAVSAYDGDVPYRLRVFGTPRAASAAPAPFVPHAKPH